MNRIRELRKKSNVSVPELARAISVTNAAITNYEHAYRKPDVFKCMAMAEFFSKKLGERITVEAIFGNPRNSQIEDESGSIAVSQGK